MTFLCKYANIAGTPGTGFHETRFLGMAAYDLFGTLLIAALITFLLFRFAKIETPLLPAYVVAALFALAIFFHWLFCVPTALNKALRLA